tara:strand:- start:2611 stop:4323 length:1713 start_codon:yes stop_codon:yes gene_type:complete
MTGTVNSYFPCSGSIETSDQKELPNSSIVPSLNSSMAPSPNRSIDPSCNLHFFGENPFFLTPNLIDDSKLREVECELKTHPNVTDAVVVNIKYDNVQANIAFVVLSNIVEPFRLAEVVEGLKQGIAQKISPEAVPKGVVVKPFFPPTIEGCTNRWLFKQEALGQLQYSKTEFINFLHGSSKKLIEHYISHDLVNDLITELLENSNSGGDKTVSTSKKIIPLFENILTKEFMDLIKRIVTNRFENSWVHCNIMPNVAANYYYFFTILNDSFCKLQNDFIEEFNDKCNKKLSEFSKFSQDEVASFSLFMILDALSDTFRGQYSNIKLYIETQVAVSYHSRLDEFQRRVTEYGIERSLLAGSIMKPSKAQLQFSKDYFIGFLHGASKNLIEHYIYHDLVNDLITELLENSNSGGDETVSTSKKIVPLFENILPKESMDLIKLIVTNSFEKSWVYRNITPNVAANYYYFFTILNDSFYKLQNDFVEKFNDKCNKKLSGFSKFSQDEVASFSLFMILDALSDTFRGQYRNIKSFIKTQVAVRYHSRLPEFQRRVIEYNIQRSLLAGGIIQPLNNN